MSDAEAMVHAGADRAVATELEAVVGLFDDILRHYQVDPDDILRDEETLRRGSYQAFDDALKDTPAVQCELDADCFSTRTVTVRSGSNVADRAGRGAGPRRAPAPRGPGRPRRRDGVGARWHLSLAGGRRGLDRWHPAVLY